MHNLNHWLGKSLLCLLLASPSVDCHEVHDAIIIVAIHSIMGLYIRNFPRPNHQCVFLKGSCGTCGSGGTERQRQSTREAHLNEPATIPSARDLELPTVAWVNGPPKLVANTLSTIDTGTIIIRTIHMHHHIVIIVKTMNQHH